MKEVLTYTGAAITICGLLLLLLLNFMPVPKDSILMMAGINTMLEYPIHTAVGWGCILTGAYVMYWGIK